MNDNGIYFMDDSCFENKNFKQELTDSDIESKLIKKAENWLREHLINDAVRRTHARIFCRNIP